MNKSCKEYIKEIKAMFPIKGRAERKYIKKLSIDVEEYCEDAGAISKEDLYENYGTPFNVVESYFSVTGISYVSKKLKISKYIKNSDFSYNRYSINTFQLICLYYMGRT